MCEITPFSLPCCRRVYVSIKRGSTCPSNWPKAKCPSDLCLQVGDGPEERPEGICWRCRGITAGKSNRELESMRPGIDAAFIVDGITEMGLAARERRAEVRGQCWHCSAMKGCRHCSSLAQNNRSVSPLSPEPLETSSRKKHKDGKKESGRVSKKKGKKESLRESVLDPGSSHSRSRKTRKTRSSQARPSMPLGEHEDSTTQGRQFISQSYGTFPFTPSPLRFDDSFPTSTQSLFQQQSGYSHNGSMGGSGSLPGTQYLYNTARQGQNPSETSQHNPNFVLSQGYEAPHWNVPVQQYSDSGLQGSLSETGRPYGHSNTMGGTSQVRTDGMGSTMESKNRATHVDAQDNIDPVLLQLSGVDNQTDTGHLATSSTSAFDINNQENMFNGGYSMKDLERQIHEEFEQEQRDQEAQDAYDSGFIGPSLLQF